MYGVLGILGLAALGLYLFTRPTEALSGTGSGSIAVTPDSAPDKIQALSGYINMAKLSYSFLMDIPGSVIMAICSIESNLTADALGSAGERGLMQIKPATWRDAVKRASLTASIYTDTVENMNNPQKNIVVGSAYLWLVRKELVQAGKVNPDDWPSIVEAYNVGPAGWMSGKRNSVHKTRFINAWNKWKAKGWI